MGPLENKTSIYKYVTATVHRSGKVYWRVRMIGVSNHSFPTERKAAIAADILLIKKGKEPINILVKKIS